MKQNPTTAWYALVRIAGLCALSVMLTACGDQNAPQPAATNEKANGASAAGSQSQAFTIHEAYLRQPAPGQRMVAAFVTLTNNTNGVYTLNHVSSPQASAIEVHRTTNNDGMMSMRPVQQLTVPPQSQVVFEPGGYHLMLSGIAGNLEPGDQVPLRFHFAEGKTLEVNAEVREVH